MANNKDSFSKGLMSYIADRLPYGSSDNVIDNISATINNLT